MGIDSQIVSRFRDTVAIDRHESKVTCLNSSRSCGDFRLGTSHCLCVTLITVSVDIKPHNLSISYETERLVLWFRLAQVETAVYIALDCDTTCSRSYAVSSGDGT